MGTDEAELQTLALDVLLLGAPQSGKSATGNVLLGSRDFPSSLSLAGVTRECQLHRRVFPGFLRRRGEEVALHLRVLDTPGYPGCLLSPERVKQAVAEGAEQAFAGGPHVVALVVRADVPFCEDGHQLLRFAEELFGPGWKSHTLLVLSHAGRVDQAGIDREEYLRQSSGPFHTLLASLEHGYHFVENSVPWLQTEGRTLLEKLLLVTRRNRYRRLQLSASDSLPSKGTVR
ncbi:GTPase IMAP family member GIMD1 [Arapaima gigas]